MKSKNSIHHIVAIALFAALVTVCTTIHFNLPTPVGTAFVHFGSSMFMLAVLLLGFRDGALAGGIGFAIFDVMNGFAPEAPYFIVECFIVAGVMTLTKQLFKNNEETHLTIFITVLAGALTKIFMTFLKNTAIPWYLGSTLTVAMSSSLGSLYVTVINAIISIIIVNLTYFPLKKALQHSIGKHI